MFGNRFTYIKGDYGENTGYLGNPDCGWYHIYTLYPQKAFDKEMLRASVDKEEKLALLFINIEKYRNGVIDDKALDNIREYFDIFIGLGMHLIVRIAYDDAGLGEAKEPPREDIIRDHMSLIGGVLKEYADYILVVQGLFVGSWGEMHSSKYLKNDAGLIRLAKVLYAETEGSVCIAVRRPDQYRIIKGTVSANKLALFNDAICASESDMNTYGVNKSMYVDYTEEEIRRVELRWQRKTVGNVPNGGEALWGDGSTLGGAAICDMRDMHLSYLNSAYDIKQLDVWKKEIYTGKDSYNGISVYDYIGAHLGYRYVIRDTKLSKKAVLKIDIENVGFACAYKEIACIVEFKPEDGAITEIEIDFDMRCIRSGETKRLEIDISGYISTSVRFDVYIKMYSKADNSAIRFANNNIDNKTFLGKIYL